MKVNGQELDVLVRDAGSFRYWHERGLEMERWLVAAAMSQPDGVLRVKQVCLDAVTPSTAYRIAEDGRTGDKLVCAAPPSVPPQEEQA